MDHLGNARVEQAFELSRSVGEEAHQWMGFLRFRELESGILYAKFRPKNRVLTCVAPHFADRFSVDNWMIYDETYGEYAVHEKGKRWVLVSGSQMEPDAVSANSGQEEKFRALWRMFTDTIAIAERTNP